jgi:NAD(P)-dependent dehydrogenase (short-subunit alcohol dehydrogenase family)
MKNLNGKNVVIIGGSQGVGREMVIAASKAGATVLAVARREGPLAQLAAAHPEVRTLAADMADETTPARIFETMHPDVLVVCGGATPAVTSLQDQTWETFSQVWESDVHGSFNICKAALNAPLQPGSTVVLVSSGAGLGGSPLSGGYAGAKRMQMFIAEYAQEESDRHELGLRFLSIVPRYMMPDTAIGKNASEGYAKYRGITVEQFLSRFEHPQTTTDVADALITLLTEEPPRSGNVFAVNGQGITEVQ